MQTLIIISLIYPGAMAEMPAMVVTPKTTVQVVVVVTVAEVVEVTAVVRVMERSGVMSVQEGMLLFR